MNPLRETFHFLYANRLKRHDPIAAFRALVVTTILAYLNLLAATFLTDSFTGYSGWLAKHGVPTLVVIMISLVAIGIAQYFCWIYKGKLERERARIDRGESPKRIVVFTYIVLSILCFPVISTLMHYFKS